MAQLTNSETVVLLNQTNGISLIPKPTPLTRLNYYDGKFLRAADMQAEQEYLRRLQQFSNQAGGAGVVHGFDITTLAGDQLQLGAGLAIDNEGRVLFLPQESSVGIEELIARSQQQISIHAGGVAGKEYFALCEVVNSAPTATPVAGVSLYVIGIARAEALCGQEDVYGKLCEEACVSGTERPYRLEGVVLRALPLVLNTPLPTSSAVTMEQIHLRSRVASAYFADEGKQIGQLISAAGLQSNIWCKGAPAASGGFVPLAVIARAGGHTTMLDSWTARRERIDSHPRRYWQWRMMMRPWDVYLAQILQFQCQLRDVWQSTPPTGDDPCDRLKRTVLEVGDLIAQLERQYQATSAQLAKGMNDNSMLSQTVLASINQSIQKVKGTFTLMPPDRVLIRRGIVELPSAGYLPVAPGSAITVNDQVRNLMGEGVDLRFCVVRADYVAEALQEAQHMERISLLRGLDNPEAKEEVDILVPDGEIVGAKDVAKVGWEVRLSAQDISSGKKTVALNQAAVDAQTDADAVRTMQRAGASKAAADNTMNTLDSGQRAVLDTSQAYARDLMTGAARSEARVDGSFAFHFAGLAEIAGRDAQVNQLKDWAASRDNNYEQTLWQSMNIMSGAQPAAKKAAAKASAKARTAKAADAAQGSGDIANNYSMLRQGAVQYRMNKAETVALKGTSSGVAHYAGLADAATDHVALWLSLSTQANPLLVAQGGKVVMGMELSVIMPKSGGTHYLDINIAGAELSIDSRVTQGQATAIKGTLKGNAIIRGNIGTMADAQRGVSFNVPATIIAKPGTQGLNLIVDVDFSNTLFDGTGIAGLSRFSSIINTVDQPQGATIALAFAGDKDGGRTIYSAKLLRNDAVLNVGHPLREASETAIEVVATRETSADFSGQAKADLFGQAPAAQDALTIHAKRDWVLFHRRRSKQCGAGEATQKLEARRYQLFHAMAKKETDLRKFRAVLAGGDEAQIRKVFTPFSLATFEAGRSTLSTPSTALLADWGAQSPGNRIKFGAIGSQGAAQAEGDLLAKSRLSSLEDALARGEIGNIENQVLPVLALNLNGMDGAIFLISMQESAVSHDVYRVTSQAAFKTLVANAVRNGLKPALVQAELKPFATSVFDSTGKAITGDSNQTLVSAWGNGGNPELALGFYQGTQPDTALTAETTARSQAIMGALGGDIAEVRAINIGDLNQATDTEGITVLVVETPTASYRVLMTVTPWKESFFITANTDLYDESFEDSKPKDENSFVQSVKDLVSQKARSVTVSTQTQAGAALAGEVLTAVQAALLEIGITQIPADQQRISILQPDEKNGLGARNFPEDSYAAVVFFSPNTFKD